jgi:hypothetical protein
VFQYPLTISDYTANYQTLTQLDHFYSQQQQQPADQNNAKRFPIKNLTSQFMMKDSVVCSMNNELNNQIEFSMNLNNSKGSSASSNKLPKRKSHSESNLFALSINESQNTTKHIQPENKNLCIGQINPVQQNTTKIQLKQVKSEMRDQNIKDPSSNFFIVDFFKNRLNFPQPSNESILEFFFL